LLVSCMAYTSALKMEVTCSFKTSVNFQHTTWCYIPEDRHPHNQCCENFKSYMYYSYNFSAEVMPLFLRQLVSKKWVLWHGCLLSEF
jgi:hypothetical protein